jgi:predicted DNA-binding WGR domain protein
MTTRWHLTELELCDGSHDKFWRHIDVTDAGWAAVQWGRRGSDGQTQISFDRVKLLQRINAKLAKGYDAVHGVTFHGPETVSFGGEVTKTLHRAAITAVRSGGPTEAAAQLVWLNDWAETLRVRPYLRSLAEIDGITAEGRRAVIVAGDEAMRLRYWWPGRVGSGQVRLDETPSTETIEIFLGLIDGDLPVAEALDAARQLTGATPA